MSMARSAFGLPPKGGPGNRLQSPPMSAPSGSPRQLPDLSPGITAWILGLILLGYAVGTLPYLGDFPRADWPEMGIAAPAYKLAREGVYGNDLFAGFYRSEVLNYEYMPAYPLLVALSFRVLGLGVWQARLVSVFCGLATLGLTFELGRRVLGTAAAVTAAGTLVFLRLGLVPGTSGVLLVDFARVVRYDLLVPVFVLLGCLCLVATPARAGTGERETAPWRWGLAGVCCGLATLSHVYGAFLLPVFLGLVVWRWGLGAWRRREGYLVVAGWFLALVPWGLYVLRDPAAYVGQMSRHEGRFDLLDLSFYWDNLLREYWRYGSWSGGSFEAAFLSPRVGIWLFLFGVPAASLLLWRRARSGGGQGDRLLFLSLPVMAFLLGALIHVKRHAYVALLLPFIALYVALALVAFGAWCRRRWGRGGRVLPALVGVLALTESGVGVAATLDEATRTTPYEEVISQLVPLFPPGSRLALSQPYWLGLAEYETRSVNLLLQLSRDGSVEAALERVDPDFVLLESYFLDPDLADERALRPDHRFFPWFQELRRSLERRCGEASRILQGSDYGELRIYACSSAAESP